MIDLAPLMTTVFIHFDSSQIMMLFCPIIHNEIAFTQDPDHPHSQRLIHDQLDLCFVTVMTMAMTSALKAAWDDPKNEGETAWIVPLLFSLAVLFDTRNWWCNLCCCIVLQLYIVLIQMVNLWIACIIYLQKVLRIGTHPWCPVMSWGMLLIRQRGRWIILARCLPWE